MLTPQFILISEIDIQRRVHELGIQIANDYKEQELVLLCVLSGAVMFYADLARAIYRAPLQVPLQSEIEAPLSAPGPLRFEFVQLSSYKRSTKPSEVELIHGGSDALTNKHVLIVEDIVESGSTLALLMEHLSSLNPKTVKVCVLLNKPSPRKIHVNIDYCGFEIPNVFVVGYGLDYDARYRNLPYIAALEGSADQHPGKSLVCPGKTPAR